MKSSSLMIILITVLYTTAVSAANPPSGYQQVPEPATTASPGKIQVIDFFWYGCPYCNNFEPRLEDWLAKKPESVDFIRVPAIIRQRWSHHARTFYTAEILGISGSLHERIFEAIHKERQDLDEMDNLAGIFSEEGIDRARFEETFHSDTVSQMVQEARLLTHRFGIDSVPAIVVNGKYRTSPELAGGASRILEVVNELIATEQEQRRTP